MGGRRAPAAATAGPRPDSTALLPPARPPRRASARLARGGGRAGADSAEALVRRSVVAPCVSCGICGGLLRDATTFSECLHAFCRKCIYDKFEEEDIKCCPTCGIHLGSAPLEKLRPDHSLQHIRSMIFPSKRRKVGTVDKRKDNVSAESTLSSLVDIAVEGSTAPMAQKIEVEVIDEAAEALVVQESVYESSTLNLAPVGRDDLSRIRCRDFYSACSLSAETGALIVWQPPPILEELVVHDRLAPRQDPETFGPPGTSGSQYLGQTLTVQMTNTSVLAGSSFHARMTVQDDEKLKGDIITLFNESNVRIMGRYDVYISQLKADNSKLIEQLENQRAAALESARILEERHQQELENERATAAERTRILEERLQRELEDEREAVRKSIKFLEERLKEESQIAMSTRSRSLSLEAENSRLYEELENGRADNHALMSDNLKTSDEIATLKYYTEMLESDKSDLENQVEHLKKDLEYAKKEHVRYVRQVLDAARAVPNNLKTLHSDAQL
ncbi:E3 ubiquitin protein ligase DRIP1 [Dichanthelium oligosanthes]|uniref:E3 ubiquitin protein ligase DRIP1 n=1 Tax=Dichanthelium oligosanthes TaxID=888268 RepID=A0A1E5VLX8_9POAL|nr:E3 ubiquitin protein ligase DRIP1 [Dichanthelium oligosanthes]